MMKTMYAAALVAACGAIGVAHAQTISERATNQLGSNAHLMGRAPFKLRPTQMTNLRTGETVIPRDSTFGTRGTVVFNTFDRKTFTVGGVTFSGRTDEFNMSWGTRADYVNGTGDGLAFTLGLWDADNSATPPQPPNSNGLDAPFDDINVTDILFDNWTAVDAEWPGGDALIPAVLERFDFIPVLRNNKQGAQEEPRILNVFFWNADPLDPSIFVAESAINVRYDVPVNFAGYFDDFIDYTQFSTQDLIQGFEGDVMYDWVNDIITTSCPADLNDDGFVDDTDFVTFAACYEAFLADGPCIASDFNGDGFVDDTDFVTFAAAYEEFLCPDTGTSVTADGVGIANAGGRYVLRLNAFVVQGPQGTGGTRYPTPEELLSAGFVDGGNPGQEWAWIDSATGGGADPAFDFDFGFPGADATTVSYVDIYNTGAATRWWNGTGDPATTQYNPPAGSQDFPVTANETPRKITVAAP